MLSEDPETPYATEDEALLQLQRLLLFLNLRDEKDLDRLGHYCKRQMKTSYSGGSWPMAYLRLQEAVLGALERQLKTVDRTDNKNGTADLKDATAQGASVLESSSVMPSLEALCFLTDRIPRESVRNARRYYRVMAEITHNAFTHSDSSKGMSISICSRCPFVMALQAVRGSYQFKVQKVLFYHGLVSTIACLRSYLRDPMVNSLSFRIRLG